jgi:hypothetical protein
MIGCKTPQDLLGMNEVSPQPTVAEIAAENNASVVPVKKLPGQTQAVLGALLSALRGEKTMAKNVSFDPKGMHEIGDPDVEWKYYGVAAIEIDIDIVVPENKTTSLGILRGVFNFVSDIGQKRSEFFYANYTITNKRKLVITESATGPVYPDFPSVTCFIVDNEALMQSAPMLTSFRALYLFALDNSYNMFATPEETAKKAEFDQLSFFDKMKSSGLLHNPVDGKFAVLVFMMDRISPTARFEIKMNGSKTGVGLCPTDPLYLLFDEGYAMGMYQGEGKIMDTRSPFYVHAYYMKEDVEGAKRERIARFSSEKIFALDVLSTTPGSEWVTNSLEESSFPNTRKTTGLSRLLDPRNRDDARLIQQTLKDKGYYKSKVDGLFGKGSQKALFEYKKEEMGQENNQWDMATQRHLFN